MTTADPGRVLLLHGILRTSRSMAKLERRLIDAGFRTLNLDYPSRAQRLEDLAAGVRQRAAAFLAPQGTALHIVAYSMGSLIARVMLAREIPADLGRVVMLAPPNHGSEAADVLVRTRLYHWVAGPAGAQLTTRGMPDLPPVNYSLGIIARDRSFDPVFWFVIPGANDGKVAVARTALEGMTDHVTVHATHTFMPRNREAARRTIRFPRYGSFSETKTE